VPADDHRQQDPTPKGAGPSKTSAGRTASLSAAALELAANGWAVFPCKWRGEDAKAPLTTNGHHDASRDPSQIKAWWRCWPKAMIGAPVPDSLLVIDIDPRNGGDLEKLVALVGDLPPTLTAWSGRNDGGCHLYYLRPHGSLTSTRLPEGIDLKANGYCIVPPSIHPATGLPYMWIDHPFASLPYRLRELLRPHSHRSEPIEVVAATRRLRGWCAQSPARPKANETKCCFGLRAEPPRTVSSIKSAENSSPRQSRTVSQN
jgi:hypothetical protein